MEKPPNPKEIDILTSRVNIACKKKFFERGSNVCTFDQRFVVWFLHFQEYSGHFSSLTQTLEHGVHEASVPKVTQPHATSTLGKRLCIGCLW